MDTTEAADLARVILEDSEGDRPTDLYTLNVHEARTLARAVARVEALADELDTNALWAINHLDADDGAKYHARHVRGIAAHLRTILKGDAA